MALREYEKSLADVLGKKIIDVAGYVSAEYGDDTLVFKLTRILFDDGTAEDVEGEHDIQTPTKRKRSLNHTTPKISVKIN